jgi:hypothetical protein
VPRSARFFHHWRTTVTAGVVCAAFVAGVGVREGVGVGEAEAEVDLSDATNVFDPNWMPDADEVVACIFRHVPKFQNVAAGTAPPFGWLLYQCKRNHKL